MAALARAEPLGSGQAGNASWELCPRPWGSQGALAEGLGWMCWCSSWGSEWDVLGLWDRGIPAGREQGQAAREDDAAHTLLLPRGSSCPGLAAGDRVTCSGPLNGGTGRQLGLLQLGCLATGWAAVAVPWHGHHLARGEQKRAAAWLSWASIMVWVMLRHLWQGEAEERD